MTSRPTGRIDSAAAAAAAHIGIWAVSILSFLLFPAPTSLAWARLVTLIVPLFFGAQAYYLYFTLSNFPSGSEGGLSLASSPQPFVLNAISGSLLITLLNLLAKPRHPLWRWRMFPRRSARTRDSD